MRLAADRGIPLTVGLAQVTDRVPTVLIDRVVATLHPARQERLRRLRRRADLERGALADALGRMLVADTTGLPLSAVRLLRTTSGAPQVQFDSDLPKPCPQISLTHADAWVGCALADTPVGIDVEVVRSHAAARLAAALPAAHADGLWLLTEPDRSRHAVRLWTAIEAYLKLLGTGLAVDPRDVRLIHSWGARVAASVPGRRPGRIRLLDLDDRYVLAVAGTGPLIDTKPQIYPAHVVLRRYLAAQDPSWRGPLLVETHALNGAHA